MRLWGAGAYLEQSLCARRGPAWKRSQVHHRAEDMTAGINSDEVKESKTGNSSDLLSCSEIILEMKDEQIRVKQLNISHFQKVFV